jgi:HK97 family phage portal protein
MMANAARWGNAYAWIDWTKAGRPRAFWPLRPDRMKVSFVNRRLVYEYNCPLKAFSGKYLADDIIHIRTLGDELVGYSPIRLAREAIGIGMAAAQYGGKLFANGARIGGVLQVPGRLKDKAQFEGDFNRKFAAAENAHKTLVIDDGAKFVATTFPPDDAQFLETRKFSRGEICSIYRVPPHLAGDLERATNSNIEHQSLEFIKFSMLPWIVNWEQEFNRKTLGGGFHCEFLLDALERADIQSRYTAYNTGIMAGMLNQDECRAREGMNPIAGGNVHRMQMQMVPLTAPAPTEEPK